MIDNNDREFFNFFEFGNGRTYGSDADMLELKTYIGTLEGSPNGTIHVQDIFYYLIDKNHLSDWNDVRYLEHTIAEDIEAAFEYFIEHEWYEEAHRLRKAIRYMKDYFIRNDNSYEDK